MPEQTVITKVELAPAHEHKPLRFPPGFLWGAATAAHQVEGGNTRNDWWLWEQKSGRIAGEATSERASDSWNRFEEDFGLLAAHHLNAHRLSLEWSRIEPREGEWDEAAIGRYRQMLTSLRAKGISPMVTLFHFSIPQWFAVRGGWAGRNAAGYFDRFTRKVYAELGELIDFWCTQNEPMVYVVQGYLLGLWPPGKRSYREAWLAFKNLVGAHRRASDAIHELARTAERPARVGVANNLISLYSYRKHSLLDDLYIIVSDKVWNHEFYRETAGSHDFLGVNYYFHQRLSRERGRFFDVFVDIRAENREMSDIGWEIYPAGIFDVMLELKELHLPIYVTENGVATLNDDRRVRFIVSYLKELYHAIQSGIDIRGYFHWSLLDNFEWEKGYAARFGLTEVDFKTFRRTPRKSFEVYGEIARQNAISHDILRYLGHAVE
ncbi:glycoside hydrolase family 1 protein [Patescibacteria group bacterium]|nr:MAG: glycoside hydrolase family 1 protein [Patescibacteria group bacterium]